MVRSIGREGDHWIKWLSFENWITRICLYKSTKLLLKLITMVIWISLTLLNQKKLMLSHLNSSIMCLYQLYNFSLFLYNFFLLFWIFIFLYQSYIFFFLAFFLSFYIHISVFIELFFSSSFIPSKIRVDKPLRKYIFEDIHVFIYLSMTDELAALSIYIWVHKWYKENKYKWYKSK